MQEKNKNSVVLETFSVKNQLKLKKTNGKGVNMATTIATDNKEGMIQVIREKDTMLADCILNVEDIDNDILKFFIENDISFSSSISEFLLGQANLEWYVLYNDCRSKGSHVTQEVLSAFKEGLPCAYVRHYIDETDDAYEMEQKRLEYKNQVDNIQEEAESAAIQENEEIQSDECTNMSVASNEKVTFKDKKVKNYHVETVEGELISDFIQCVMNVNDTSYNDDKLTEAIQKNVMDLVNINKERNKENQELKKSINMYQTYCGTCDSKISQLKEQINQLTIENTQKDSEIRELTEKNMKFNEKLNELMAIQQLNTYKKQ